MSNRAALLSALVSWTLAGAASPADEAWVEVKTPGFTVFGDDGEKAARRLAGRLEEMRAFLQIEWPWARPGPLLPVVVVALRDRAHFEALLPSRYGRRGAVSVAGITTREPDRTLVLLRTDQRGDPLEENPNQVLYHEYVHAAVGRSLHLPPWLNEGLAEFWGGTRITARQVELGRPIGMHLRTLRQRPLLSLDTLFRVDGASSDYNEQDRATVFYAESWALVHYLLLGAPDRRGQLNRLAERLAEGWEPLDATRAVLGDPGRLQRQLEEYTRRHTWKSDVRERRWADGHTPGTTRRLEPAEVLALRGRVLLSSDRPHEGMEQLERALERPWAARAQAAGGFPGPAPAWRPDGPCPSRYAASEELRDPPGSTARPASWRRGERPRGFAATRRPRSGLVPDGWRATLRPPKEDSMERRAFLAATTAAAVTSADALAGAAGATAEPATAARPQVLELRRYRLRNGALATRFAAYAKDALVPALGRAGLSPIGAWNVALGPDSPTLHLLLPHPDAASVVTLDARLDADGEYRKAAASTLVLPPADPPFLSCDSSLHAAVATMPGVEKPTGARRGKGPRLRAADLQERHRGREPEEDRDVRGGRGARALPPRGPQHGVLRPRPRGPGSAQPDLHGGVRRRRRPREGLGGLPRAPGVGEDARRSPLRRHRLQHRLVAAPADGLLADLAALTASVGRGPPAALSCGSLGPGQGLSARSTRILTLRNETRLPWSWSRIGPLGFSPKAGQTLYLLSATSLRNASEPRSYSRTFAPLSQCSTWRPSETIRASFHSPIGFTFLPAAAGMRS